MSKNINTKECYSCEKRTKQFMKANSSGCDKKVATKVVVPKKVLISKNVLSNANSRSKSCSTSVIGNSKNISTRKHKKTTKSDVSFDKNITRNPLDYCKRCGDSLQKQSLINNRKEIQIMKPKQASTTAVNCNDYKSIKHSNSIKVTSNIQQYYKNEKFYPSTETVNTEDLKRIPSLDTIKEVSEIRTPEESTFKVYTDVASEKGCLDTDNIRELKEFRKKNYFECHSAKSRIKHKPSVTNLVNHKCVYRFYLNERLFPAPLNTDFNNRIRCVECHLPMDLKRNDGDKINGTIQAKVRLGDKVKDLMLLLPAREPLIIKEKRKEEKAEQEEVYFGVIKLTSTGHSVFNNATFDESLALRYQKGFKQFKNECPSYKTMKEDDLIFI